MAHMHASMAVSGRCEWGAELKDNENIKMGAWSRADENRKANVEEIHTTLSCARPRRRLAQIQTLVLAVG